jgi:hypothetical protein
VGRKNHFLSTGNRGWFLIRLWGTMQRVLTLPPLLSAAKAGRNNLNE